MAVLLTFPSDKGKKAVQKLRERGIPEGLGGIPPEVAKYALSQCERCEQILRHLRELEAERIIPEQNGYETVIHTSDLKGRRSEAESVAVRHVVERMRENGLGDPQLGLTFAEMVVIVKLLKAGGGDLEEALKRHDILDVNEHATFHVMSCRIFWNLEQRQKRRELGPDDAALAA